MGPGALAVQAIQRAADDAGLDMKDIDGISTYTRPAEALPGMSDGIDFVGVDFLVRTLHLRRLTWYASLDRAVVAAAFIHALHALYSGACQYALVYRALHNATGALLANSFTDTVATHGREF